MHVCFCVCRLMLLYMLSYTSNTPALQPTFDTAIQCDFPTRMICANSSPSLIALNFDGDCSYNGHCQPFMVSPHCYSRIFWATTIILSFNQRDEANISLSSSYSSNKSEVIQVGSALTGVVELISIGLSPSVPLSNDTSPSCPEKSLLCTGSLTRGEGSGK